MSVRILIADPDESFGLMLKQILETNSLYVADAYTTAAATLASAQKRKPDLVIIDAALADMSAAALIASLQLIRPGVSIMLIPMGNTLPEEYQQLGVRGILTKPFFVGNLDTYIRDVLNTEPTRASQTPPDFAQKKTLTLHNTAVDSPPSRTAVHTPGQLESEGQKQVTAAATFSTVPAAQENAASTLAKPGTQPSQAAQMKDTAGPTDGAQSKATGLEKRTTASGAVTSIAKAASNLAARISRPQKDNLAGKAEAKTAGEPPGWVSDLSTKVDNNAANHSTPSEIGSPVTPAIPPNKPFGDESLSVNKSEIAENRHAASTSPEPKEIRSATAPPRVRQTVSPPRRGVPESDSGRPALPIDPNVAIERTLASLIRELRADAVYVLKNGDPLYTRGGLSGLKVEALGEVLRRWASTASELAALVGENRGRFVQFHAEGERYHVYAFDTGSGFMLVVICRTDIPFGTLRLTLKTAGTELTKLVRS